MSNKSEQGWLQITGVDTSQVAQTLTLHTQSLIADGLMPPNEPERVATLSTGISKGAFVVSQKRLELLRGLCHLYSAGIRAEKISSHRRILGPVIVFVKKAIFRVLSALLGPTFQYQRDFNAGVIRLLGDLCNEERAGNAATDRE